MSAKTDIATPLLDWFDQHGRKDLPWQVDRTPYRVWVSEIMLQQTQVSTVIPFYERFMDQFPDVVALASAAEDAVLHLWTGLGYYARARNLHRCAKHICDAHGGVFPSDLAGLEALPGIGRSTAGAILCLAMDTRAPILDGNVKWVLARYHAFAGWPGQRAVSERLWASAEQHTPWDRVADYTQAIMDLGATVCTRSKPDCARCPLTRDCLARKQNNQTAYPGKKPRKRYPRDSAGSRWSREAQAMCSCRSGHHPASGGGSGHRRSSTTRPVPEHGLKRRWTCRAAIAPSRHPFTTPLPTSSWRPFRCGRMPQRTAWQKTP